MCQLILYWIWNKWYQMLKQQLCNSQEFIFGTMFDNSLKFDWHQKHTLFYIFSYLWCKWFNPKILVQALKIIIILIIMIMFRLILLMLLSINLMSSILKLILLILSSKKLLMNLKTQEHFINKPLVKLLMIFL